MPGRKKKQSRAMAQNPLDGVLCRVFPSESSTTERYDETRNFFDSSIYSTVINTDIVQNIHESARMFQVAFEKHKSLTKGPLFTKAWLGVDHNAWIRSISYQVLPLTI
jgi:diphthamide synthase subunit DPH2